MSLRLSLPVPARRWALLLSFAAALGVGCLTPRSQPKTPQPTLCSEHPELCRPCKGSECAEPRKSGWVCCPREGGNCIAVLTASECTSGVVGWCQNYTESDIGVATCHDTK